ncbi:hypothetical protein BC828DRAFT_391935 [Blastocladiella britannica]|nr:hypothetical protein BC828DRAFT_391935 [Blastocladiella britannica]
MPIAAQFFDPCHTALRGSGADQLAALLVASPSAARVVAPLPFASRYGLFAAGDAAGDLHVALAPAPSSSASSTSSTSHLVSSSSHKRLRTADRNGPHNTGPSSTESATPAVVHEGYVDPANYRITCVSVVATVPARRGGLVPVPGTSSSAPMVAVLVLGAVDHDHMPVIRVVQYDPASAVAVAAMEASGGGMLASEAPPSSDGPPFRILREIRIGPTSIGGAAAAAIGGSTGSIGPGGGARWGMPFLTGSGTLLAPRSAATANGNGNGGHTVLGEITHLAYAPSPSPALLVGFSSGALVLLKGDVVADRPARQILLRDATMSPPPAAASVSAPLGHPAAATPAPSSTDPITGMVFSGFAFFVTTAATLMVVNLARGSGDALETLDATHGSRCAPVVWPSPLLDRAVASGNPATLVGPTVGEAVPGSGGSLCAVVQDSSLVVYDAVSGRVQTIGLPLASEAAVTSMGWLAPHLSPYLAVVSSTPSLPRDTLHILHTDLPGPLVVAHTATVPTVRAVVPVPGGNVLVIVDAGAAILPDENGHDGVDGGIPTASAECVVRLKLRPVDARLRELAAIHAYTAALALAEAERAPAAAVADLRFAYAKHLVAAPLATPSPSSLPSSPVSSPTGGAATAAASAADRTDLLVAQLRATLGHVPVSHVVRLLATRPRALAAYLTAVHDAGMARAEHTAALVHALVRVHDTAGVQRLLLLGTSNNGTSSSAAMVDVPVAVECLADGGMPQVAVDLALAHAQYDLAAGILAFRMRDMARAGHVVDRVDGWRERANLLVRGGLGAELATACPVDTLATVTGIVRAAGDEIDAETIVKLGNLWPVATASGKVEAAHDTDDVDRGQQQQGRSSMAAAAEVDPVVQAGSRFFRYVVLENAAARAAVGPTVWNEAIDRCATGEDALEILKHPESQADLSAALLTARSRHWIAALLYLYSRLGNPQAMLEVHMQLTGNMAAMHQIAVEHAPRDAAVWRRLLAYACTQDPLNEGAVRDALRYIDEHSVMEPSEVVREVARNPRISFGMVREMVRARVDRDRAVAKENADLAQTYRAKTKQMQAEIGKLDTEPVTFQSTQCDACQSVLSMPVAHFFCRHSFHARCLNDNTKQCPRCSREHASVANLKRTLQARGRDDFYGQLEAADDGYAVVAEWYSRKEIRP